MRLLVGCPVSDRSWILDEWYYAVLRASAEAWIDPHFVFVVPEWDIPSISMMKKFNNTTIVTTDEEPRSDVRQWNPLRYEQLVTARNLLLTKVREIEPQFFLSLDSDILLHLDAIASMFDAFGDKSSAWALGSKCFLSPRGTLHPNYGMWKQRPNQFTRADHHGLIEVDILMAIKLMKPEAYAIDYSFNGHGEDLGWSMNVKDAGGRLYWDGRVTNKHIMKIQDLDHFDERAGF